METNLQFEVKDVDDVSSIPNAHLSYIVQQLLPIRHIGRKRLDEFDEYFNQRTDIEDDDITVLPVGSLAEGLNMPSVIVRKTGEEIRGGNFTDMDVMLIMRKYPVTFQRSKMSTGEYHAYIETNDIHPGYARLNLVQQSENPKYQDRELTQLRMKMRALQTSEDPDKIEINGPALTINQEPWTRSNLNLASRAISTDQVMALPCSEWPPIANDWICRSRDQSWLDEQQVNSLVKDGCHIVAACHRLSKTPKEEWRISFAATERRIAREAITDHQRQVYIFIKLLYHQSLKKLESITSYHLKTAFLYACEMIPSTAWIENTGTCIFFLLDLLIECVKKIRLPSFFLPDNNLFDYFDEKELQSILEVLVEIRKNPILHALEFTKDNLISRASVQHPMRTLMEPVVSDITRYFKDGDIRLTLLEAFIPTTFKILTTQLEEGKNEEAVHVATDLHAMLVKHKMTEETLGEFCFWNIANHLTDGRMSVAFLEKAVALHEGDPDFDSCRNNLPCMYHAAAYRYPRESDKHAEYVKKADAAFLSRFEHQGVSGGYCDYVLFLKKQNRLDDAITWLDKLLASKNDQFANVYDASEIMTLDDILQNEVIEHNSFSSPSLSLAFYLKNDCLVAKGHSKNDLTEQLLCKFKQHAEEMKLPRTYALLGYSYMLVGNLEAASEAFGLAISTNTEMQYTRAIKMKRYCDSQISQLKENAK